MNRRIDRVSSGELNWDDFTKRGALGFLTRLSERSIILHLASGTDQDDVVREATALGYAYLFEDRIVGAIGKVDVEAKREVIRKIMGELGEDAGDNIMVIGDGPVEIRECARAGGFALGNASDEIRRFGVSRQKRRRVIQAGANVVVPDFTQTVQLIGYLEELNVLP